MKSTISLLIPAKKYKNKMLTTNSNDTSESFAVEILFKIINERVDSSFNSK